MVFPRWSSDPDIVNGVYWSEALNKVFVDNFERDPTLTWQYFGSAKGFFRQYPGEERQYVCACVCVVGGKKRKTYLKEPSAVSTGERKKSEQMI